MKPISNTDPWIEIHGRLLADTDLDNPLAVTPFKIATGVTRNTKLSLAGNGSLGITGAITLEYDRLELHKLINTFGGVEKIPTVRLMGDAGTTITLASIFGRCAIHNAY